VLIQTASEDWKPFLRSRGIVSWSTGLPLLRAIVYWERTLDNKIHPSISHKRPIRSSLEHMFKYLWCLELLGENMVIVHV